MELKSAGTIAPEAREFMPNTAYAVLGLLSFGQALCGYEIRQWARNSLAHFYWSPAQSQIYRELNRLEEAGYIAGQEITQADRPAKTAYAITPSGQAELSRWLNEAPLASIVLKHPAAMRVFFGQVADPDRLLAILDTHRAALDTAMAELEAANVALADEPDAAHAVLVNEWTLDILRADMAGASRAVAVLKQQKRS